MKFWWVNHNQTAREEISGDFLWSPKREASGARSHFYDNMRRAMPSDLVLSFSNGVVGHLGTVQDFALPALKPSSFASSSETWSKDDWMLPVTWQRLSAPVRPKMLIAELGPFLPRKYSPIHPISGNGNQKAYLAEVGQHVFNLLIDSNVRAARTQTQAGSLSDICLKLDDASEEALDADPALDKTAKQQLTLARRGQGLFRSRVADIERACRLTGIQNPALLVASHIKPWRVCANSIERLDGANGLLLAPHVDRLFDRGLISFEASGRVLLSPYSDPLDLDRLGLRDACSRSCGEFEARQETYLAYHRESVFLG